MTRLKLNNASIKIVCLENGIIYDSLTHASKELKLNLGSLSSHLKGNIKAVKGYKFLYFDDAVDYIKSLKK